MNSILPLRAFRPILLALALASVPRPALPATEAPKEADLIRVLQSDAPSAEKAITCKKLAIYGSKEAVPSIAPLLTDPQLTSWARIALEAIPDPSASEALRNAIPKTQGRVLVGVINSLGVRHDAEAVSALIEKLADADDNVACAAAEALGNIGGDSAVAALQPVLSSERARVRSSAAYACSVAAENLLTQGDSAQAVRLYDTIRKADLPKQRILEATRGAILARGSAGIPLLLEQLRSADVTLFDIGLNAARELPGRDVTQALATELDQASPDRQVSLLLALSDRTDDAVLPKLLQAAESGPKPVRIAAVGLFDRFRDLASVPVLLNAAADDDADLARPAKAALARLGSKEVDADLLARLRLASGKSRLVLIELAEQRRISGAVPVVLESTQDANDEVRRAAIRATGVLGTERQTAELVHLLSRDQSLGDREEIETALVALCGKTGAASLSAVQPLAEQGESASRIIGLHALAAIGGPEALQTVVKAGQDSDQAIQDEAVRTLASWPNTWPEDSGVAEPLLALAKTGKKVSYRAQGLQGYLLYVQENKKLSNDERLDKIRDLLPTMQSPEQKRLAISTLSSIQSEGALSQLMELSQDDTVAEESYLGIVKIATDRNVRNIPADVRRKALQRVAEKSQNDANKKRAEDALKRIR